MVAIGEGADRLDQLDASYQTAKLYSQQANLLASQTVHTSSTTSSVNRISIAAKKDLLLHALDTGSVMYARNILKEFFEEIRRLGYFSMEMMLQCNKEFRVIAEQLVRMETYCHLNKRLFSSGLGFFLTTKL